MFNEVRTLIEQASSAEGQQAVQKAATDHIQQMNDAELQQKTQDAAQNARQNGDTSIAQMLEQLLSNGQDSQSLKDRLIALVTSNPQILQHFESDFAKNILSRV